MLPPYEVDPPGKGASPRDGRWYMLAAELLAISIGESSSSVRGRFDDDGPAVAFTLENEPHAARALCEPLGSSVALPVELIASKTCSVRLRLISA